MSRLAVIAILEKKFVESLHMLKFMFKPKNHRFGFFIGYILSHFLSLTVLIFCISVDSVFATVVLFPIKDEKCVINNAPKEIKDMPEATLLSWMLGALKYN